MLDFTIENAFNRYSYRLFVDGKEIESFRERQSKILKTWIYMDHPEAEPTRVTLERDTMDVYVNGEKVGAPFGRYMGSFLIFSEFAAK